MSTRTEKRSQLVLPPDTRRAAHPLDRITLDGRNITMVVGARITAAHRQVSMLGASSITLDFWDGDRRVLSSGMLGVHVMTKEARIELDGIHYVATGLSRSGPTLSIRFESWVVSTLRTHGQGKPLSSSRDDVTRAEFCARMIRTAGFPVIVLDEHNRQTIAGATKAATRTASTPRPTGFTGTLKVKGAAASSEQRRNGAAVVAALLKYKATHRASLAAMEAAIIENELSNSGVANDHASVGVFQAQPGISGAIGGVSKTITRSQALDIDYCVRVFLERGFWIYGGAEAIARKNPGMSSGQIAYHVEGCAAQYAGRYDTAKAEAQQWLDAGGVAGGSGPTGNTTSTKKYMFERKRSEGTWGACGRLIEEVGWRIFDREGTIIIASDDALMRAPSALVIDAAGDYVLQGVDFEDHRGMDAAEASCQLLASRYQVDAGEVAEVLNQNHVQPRWLVSTASIGLMPADLFVDVALTQPVKALPEPAPETEATSRASGGPTTASTTGAISGTPHDIINTIVLPLCRQCGIPRTSAENDAANLRHGPVNSGAVSDHQPPWSQHCAADMSDGVMTAREKTLAKALAQRFSIPWSGAGCVSATHGGYRFQLIFGVDLGGGGGDHHNHVHFGVAKA